MMCAICRHGETVAAETTVTLERDGMVLVIQHVPARVCDNCGERYFDAEVTQRLLDIAREAAAAGVVVDVRNYVAA